MGADWDGVVFDLDGTLVELPVDWEAVTAELAERLEALGVEPGDGRVWGHLETARDAGALDRLEEIVSEREVREARRSERLPLADSLVELEVPVAVCSLNCERACRTALEDHGLAAHVEAVVGRDTVETWKPDPAPLEAAIDGIDVAPDRALFVGDSRRDARTAERAGVAFVWAADARERLAE